MLVIYQTRLLHLALIIKVSAPCKNSGTGGQPRIVKMQ